MVKPVRALNIVVFPAPFGPMRPKTSPVRTCSDTAFTATSPPNATVSASEVSSVLLGRLSCCAEWSTTARHLRPGPGWRVLSPTEVPQDALRAQGRHQHQQGAVGQDAELGQRSQRFRKYHQQRCPHE